MTKEKRSLVSVPSFVPAFLDLFGNHTVISGQEGDLIHLPCRCPREKGTRSGYNEWHYGQNNVVAKTNGDQTNRIRFLHVNQSDGDCSLLISEATAQDEGNYTCISNHKGCPKLIPGVGLVMGPCTPRQVYLHITPRAYPSPLSATISATLDPVTPVPAVPVPESPDIQPPMSDPIPPVIIASPPVQSSLASAQPAPNPFASPTDDMLQPSDAQSLPPVPLPPTNMNLDDHCANPNSCGVMSTNKDSTQPMVKIGSDAISDKTNHRVIRKVLSTNEEREREWARKLHKPFEVPGQSKQHQMSTDPLHGQARLSQWYRWVDYTARSLNKSDCYFCTRAEIDTLLVTNTRYSWANCDKQKEEFREEAVAAKGYPREPEYYNGRMGVELGLRYAPICPAECLQYLGSLQYHSEATMPGEDLKTLREALLGGHCKDLDVRVSADMQAVPDSTKLHLMGHFECFHKSRSFNDSRNHVPIEVGYLEEELCDSIWDLTAAMEDVVCHPIPHRLDRMSAVHMLKGHVTVPPPALCPLLYATQAVADQFWICGEHLLLNILPVNWVGRCARVEAVQAIMVIPADDITEGEKLRTKRTRRDEHSVKYDYYGVPYDIPDEHMVINHGSLVAASLFFPSIGVSVTTKWINYIYFNQQRFMNFTYEALGALGEQLAATSLMTWQNRQALDFLLAESGGVCQMVGPSCCTYIPNSTAENGTFTVAMARLKHLKYEVHEAAGVKNHWDKWLTEHFGGWGSYLAEIGAIILVVLIVLALVLCCCIPIIRSFLSRGIDRAVGFQAILMTNVNEGLPTDLVDEEDVILPDEILIETRNLSLDDYMEIHDHERGDIWDAERRCFLNKED